MPMPRDEPICATDDEYNITCYGFHEDTVHPDVTSRSWKKNCVRSRKTYDPDVIHCFGTEYPHTLAVCRVYPHGEDTGGNSGNLYVVCGGIFCRYAGIGDPQDHFPGSGEKDTLRSQQEKFARRGVMERKP